MKLEYITGTKRQDGKPIDYQAIRKFESHILRVFGGFTQVRGEGAWIDEEDNRREYREDSRIYTIYRKTSIEDDIDYLTEHTEALLYELREAFGQISVLLIMTEGSGKYEIYEHRVGPACEVGED